MVGISYPFLLKCIRSGFKGPSHQLGFSCYGTENETLTLIIYKTSSIFTQKQKRFQTVYDVYVNDSRRS